MPIEIYKLGIEGIELIVKLVRKKKLSTLKNVVKELRILLKVKSKVTRKKTKKRRTAKQIKATKKLIAFNKRRNR